MPLRVPAMAGAFHCTYLIKRPPVLQSRAVSTSRRTALICCALDDRVSRLSPACDLLQEIFPELLDLLGCRSIYQEAVLAALEPHVGSGEPSRFDGIDAVELGLINAVHLGAIHTYIIHSEGLLWHTFSMKANERALVSLKGLSVGDALGESFFGPQGVVLARIRAKNLPTRRRRYTDDTQMAISVVDALLTHGRIDQDYLARRFAERLEYDRGYGLGALGILDAIRSGSDWRDVARGAFGGRGSFGNGAAMRVAPVGAFFGSDIEQVIENARLSAEITHTHPEGIAGAVAVALAASVAATLQGTKKRFAAAAYFDRIVQNTPDSAVRDGIVRATKIPLSAPPLEAARILGSGQGISAQDTVPFVVWSAGGNMLSFEEAFWKTVEGLGDRDTTCAMVGGVVSLSTQTPIPPHWIELTEELAEGIGQGSNRIG